MAEESVLRSESDPNFAVVCSFIINHGSLLNLPELSFEQLHKHLDETKYVSNGLKDILLTLLRKWKRNVAADKWEKILVKFCHSYSEVDAWELEKIGFPRCKLSTKMRILKNLLEVQFDCNAKFKEKINMQTADKLRLQPVGRDVDGLAYWFMLDSDFNVLIFREEQNGSDSWALEMVVNSRDGLAKLISSLEKHTDSTNEENSNSAMGIEKSDKSDPVASDVAAENVTSDLNDESGAVDTGQPNGGGVKEPEKVEKLTGENCEQSLQGVASEVCKLNAKIELDNNKNSELNTEDGDLIVDKKPAVEDNEIKTELTTSLESKSLDVVTEDMKQSNAKDHEHLQETNDETLIAKPNEIKSEEIATKAELKQECRPYVIEPTAISDDIKKEVQDDSDDVKPSEAVESSVVTDVKSSSVGGQCKETHVESDTNQPAGDIHTESGDGKQCDIESNVETTDNACAQNSTDGKTIEEEGEENNASSETVNGEQVIKQEIEGDECSKEGKGEKDDDAGTVNVVKEADGEQDKPADDVGVATMPRKRLRNSPDTAKAAAEGADKAVASESTLTSESEVPCASEEPPSKRQRGRGRKKKANRSSKVKKKAAKAVTDKTDAAPVENADTTLTQSDVKKKARETVHICNDEPSSKKGRKNHVAKVDAVPDTESPSTLRRSSRSNRGQRKLELNFGMDCKSRKRAEVQPVVIEEEEESEKEATVQESTREELKQKKKKQRKTEYDEDFCPYTSAKQRRKRLASSSAHSATDDDILDALQVNSDSDDEPLCWLAQKQSDSDLGELSSSGSEYQAPGRNAKRVAARRAAAAQNKLAEEVVEDDTPCIKCLKSKHAELILLCDKCDAGYHTACLRPPLMLIPDENWYCPPCEQVMLLEKLRIQLSDLDVLLKKNDRLIKRKERIAFVGISLDNILPESGDAESGSDDVDEAVRLSLQEERQQRRDRRNWRRQRWRRRRQRRRDEEDEENSSGWDDATDEEEEEGEEETEEEEDSEDEEVVRRSRRSKKEISYKFEEFDQLISTAIHQDNSQVNYGRGKDIRNVTQSYQSSVKSHGKDMQTIIDGCRNDPEAAEYVGRTAVTDDGHATDDDDGRDGGHGDTQPMSRGKDMANIQPSLEEYHKLQSRPPPVVVRKKARRLTGLDSADEEEEEDSGDEYKVSDEVQEESDASAYEKTYISESESDDWRSNRRRRRGKVLASRKSSGRRKRSRKFDDDFVNDESSDASSGYLPVRRATVRRGINYCESSSDDKKNSDASDASSDSRDRRRQRKVDVGRKRLQDSDYRGSESDSSDAGKRGAKGGSESWDSGQEAVKKRRRNVIMTSEDEDGASDGSEAEKCDRDETAMVEKRVNGHETTPVGSPTTAAAAAAAAAEDKVDTPQKTVNQISGGFMIDNLLKDSSLPAAAAAATDDSSVVQTVDDEDLSGVDDLVSFVTQE